MRKNAIPFIVVIMSLALMGIILLQINWIRHDFLLREQRFDQQVNDAMHTVVDKLETRQAFNFISTRFFNLQNDTSFWKVLDSSMVDLHGDPVSPRFDSGAFLFSTSSLPRNGTADEAGEVSVPAGQGGYRQIELADTFKVGNTLRKERIQINTDSARASTEINRLRIDEEVIRKDVMEVRNDLMEAEVEKERTRREQELIKMKIKINSKVGKLNEVWNQLAMSFVTGENYRMRSVPPDVVDSLLQKELKNRGISTGYNFGIIDTKNDTLVAARDPAGESELRSSPYSVDLYPNEIISKGQMLHLFFPSRTTFVLSSLSWMLAGSLFFTLTIIFVFFRTVQMLLRQKELSDIKSDFINNMTHEFKTPIATISLAIDAINNPRISDDKEKVRYYSNIVKEENKRMNKQVETILQTALFEKKDFKLIRKELDLHELIHQAAANISVQVESRGGAIRLNLLAAKHHISGDEMLLTTAIVNLLDNANKYSPGEPEITITTANRENGIMVSVEDKGMGMDRETVLRIFEKFYRKSTGNIHDIKGFGLGLSNVRSIVSAHGGEIKAMSEPGKGSRFDIFLPFDTAHPA